GLNMVLGTDTGNDFNFPGYSLHEEMQLLELGGMEPLEIIKMGTLNAAKMMNSQDSLGSIETGKIANMILLDKNPLEKMSNTLLINTVIKRGAIQKRIKE
ncbi:MAG TPA: amidohydrolase family protein, partial [Cyclobacteriaceae bacterium]|nr:amidohydrolase family protein [Cyclobacteriaceae bacterium]